MPETNGWIQLIRENPDHSAWYIERFQKMAADGVDLTLVDVEGGVAHLRLGIVDATCAECVLPRDLLEPVVLEPTGD